MRALAHIEKKSPGAISLAAGAQGNRIFSDVIFSEFIDLAQA
jgi:hypothetical protein